MLNDGPRLSATFFDIGDISFDAAGNLYVADYSNLTIRVISHAMELYPVHWLCSHVMAAFVLCLAGYEDGFGTEARLSMPDQIAVATERTGSTSLKFLCCGN